MIEDTGKLVLRLALGVLMLLHGMSKLINGVDGIVGMVTGFGLPAAIAYGVYLGEVIGPLLVIVGLYTRAGALLIAGNMLFALLLAHRAELFTLAPTGGWALELQAMFLFGAVAVLLLGAGRFSVGGTSGRFN
ncbi:MULTISPECIES: DoxX family protein [Stutzerimonas stutzeri group]|uniref:GntR family transcriptional regulator n=1 Tax=Stutzerimonas degradans TaxID=2968968 RepID=A0A8E2QD95_9GAMM|nr:MULTISPECIES: DoxX family protein [Stutzerimonas stutzeri group]MCQ4277295.1 DoxX family protein [Stutzerimonas degradans]NHW03735.1 DoxX family protein [Stutzerimonas degradans]PNF75979.1 GntR family transcriptional regulator [Stutzerimonas degradans]QPT21672.1 DoxX family protein [Stutzerimonas degradans]UVO17304.1 DoxX family protein [Stutzerimonas stutzeri]